jgi:hypothetical protein
VKEHVLWLSERIKALNGCLEALKATKILVAICMGGLTFSAHEGNLTMLVRVET